MKFYFMLTCILFSPFCHAQDIVNVVWTNDTQIVTDMKDAKYLVVIKSYADTAFERLNYHFAGSMITRKTYADKNLSILNGKFASYSSTGYLQEDGQYAQNKKNGRWYIYDDTSRAITEYKYYLDSLVSVIDLDSLQKERKKIDEDTTGQVEAAYSDGPAGIMKLISKKIKVPERTGLLTKGGTVKIRFVIDTTGSVTDREVLRSVEFTFDEECLRVISLLKKWSPASDKGTLFKAYRIQPITLTF